MKSDGTFTWNSETQWHSTPISISEPSWTNRAGILWHPTSLTATEVDADGNTAKKTWTKWCSSPVVKHDNSQHHAIDYIHVNHDRMKATPSGLDANASTSTRPCDLSRSSSASQTLGRVSPNTSGLSMPNFSFDDNHKHNDRPLASSGKAASFFEPQDRGASSSTRIRDMKPMAYEYENSQQSHNKNPSRRDGIIGRDKQSQKSLMPQHHGRKSNAWSCSSYNDDDEPIDNSNTLAGVGTLNERFKSTKSPRREFRPF